MGSRSERRGEGVRLSDGFGVEVRPRKAAKGLGATVAILVGIAVILSVLDAVNLDPADWLHDLFRLDMKANIPAFFSGLLFAVSAGLSVLVWRRGRWGGASQSAGWILVAFVMLVLSFEELFGVPDQIGGLIRGFFRTLVGGGQLARALPYVFLLLVVGAVFWPLWRKLSSRARALFALAAVLYVTGAMLFEYLGRVVYTGPDGGFAYAVVNIMEETLEMSGLVVLVYALLSLLEGVSIRFGPDAAEPLQEVARGVRPE